MLSNTDLCGQCLDKVIRTWPQLEPLDQWIQLGWPWPNASHADKLLHFCPEQLRIQNTAEPAAAVIALLVMAF